MESAAAGVVLAAGTLLLVVGLYGAVLPARLMALAERFRRSGSLWLAVLIRLGVGVAMILAAPISRLPAFLTVFGIVAILAAMAIPVMGAARVGRMIEWFVAGSTFAVRVWASVAALLGVFVVWVVW